MVRFWIYFKGRADMIGFGSDFWCERRRRVKDDPKVFIPKVLIDSFHHFSSVTGILGRKNIFVRTLQRNRINRMSINIEKEIHYKELAHIIIS